jgi:threonine synthase
MHRQEITNQLGETARSTLETIMTAIRVLRAYMAARLTRALGDERGEIASWVVVTALVIVAAIAIVGIVVTKLTATANNIQTP